MFPDLGKLQVVQELNELGQRFVSLQRDDVQLTTRMMLLRSVAPREYKTVASAKIEIRVC